MHTNDNLSWLGEDRMREKKKLLVYAHYYYPDVASTGQILTELVEGLKDSFDITVISVVPSYTGKIEERYKQKKYFEEVINGVKVFRVRVPEFTKTNKKSRILNILAYFFRATYLTLRLSKQDYVYTISQPPILGGVLGVIGKILKRGKLIYNIQDFNPEQTMAINYTGNSLILKMAMYIDKLTCRMSDQIIVVGRDMVETLSKRFKNGKIPTHIFINNWIDENEIYPLEKHHSKVHSFKKKYQLEDKFIIAYSGNIGLYYDLENIMNVIQTFKDRKDVCFAFIGEGTVKDKMLSIKEERNLENIIFIPYQNKEDLIYSLNAADIHWVVNAKGIKGVSVPSKLYGVMAAGKPVLGVLEPDSEARLLIEESGCGLVTNPGNYEAIQKMINFVLKNKRLVARKGMEGRKFLEKNLTKEMSIDKYKQAINNLENNETLLEKGAVKTWVK